MLTLTTRFYILILILSTLQGCSALREFQPSVAVKETSTAKFIAQKRGEILTTGSLSFATQQTIRVTNLEQKSCANPPSLGCLQILSSTNGISDEQRLSALAELWLARALALNKRKHYHKRREERFAAWLEVIRHTYGYLFFTNREPASRAFEDRQTQVRDWYNFAVQEATLEVFKYQLQLQSGEFKVTTLSNWQLFVDNKTRMPKNMTQPTELLASSSLTFKGFRSTYRRDGFGSELVAVSDEVKVAVTDKNSEKEKANSSYSRKYRQTAWSEMPSPNITAVFHFDVNNLAQLMSAQAARIAVYDPLSENTINIHGQQVPLAGNYTAGYGLWLARSGFNRQSLQSLFGREKGIARPHLYMMQPFDPTRRVVLMIHGLGSSPEAWVNLANEILGDETLRNEFQIWQVYYPTNLPVALNHAAIRKLLEQALNTLDPGGQSRASQDLVVIGHSMGGMLARLLTSSADQQLWQWAKNEKTFTDEQLERLQPFLAPVLQFDPFDGVQRAIYIATPHRGTKAANKTLVRWIAGFVRLPLTILRSLDETLDPNVQSDVASIFSAQTNLSTSFDNLKEENSFVKTFTTLPMSDQVKYHSIIARKNAKGELENSSDGLVPYRSAHLDGAASEVVIPGGHSIQETAAAILEIQRILHEDIAELRSAGKLK